MREIQQEDVSNQTIRKRDDNKYMGSEVTIWDKLLIGGLIIGTIIVSIFISTMNVNTNKKNIVIKVEKIR